ncbi:alpha/beta fold hydrolase [Kitasatospora sp. NPDC004723]|uniref:alpha/beta fold hydrolase n=1 Tax=Kitasatospora sp. NPDC004723 TaxID=3154288 RepID=UPI0033A6B66A
MWGIAAAALHGGPLPGSAAEMARGYAELIAREFPGHPVHVGGWSFGGVLAHAVAEQLSALGHEVAGLVLIDAVLPTGAAHPATSAPTSSRRFGSPSARSSEQPHTRGAAGLDALAEVRVFRGLSRGERVRRLHTYEAIGAAVRGHRPAPVAGGSSRARPRTSCQRLDGHGGLRGIVIPHFANTADRRELGEPGRPTGRTHDAADPARRSLLRL